MIRVVLPAHLRTLARVDGEVEIEVPNVNRATPGNVLDALEDRFPVLRGAIRDHVTHKRRAYVRFFACERDISHDSPDSPLPGCRRRPAASRSLSSARCRAAELRLLQTERKRDHRNSGDNRIETEHVYDRDESGTRKHEDEQSEQHREGAV